MKAERRAEMADAGAMKAQTGRTLEEWAQAIEQGGASGRAAIGKFLQAQKAESSWIPTITVEYERLRGVVEKDGRPRGYSICATKTVNAAPAAVYDAFTSAHALDRWLGDGTRVDAVEGGALTNADGNRATIRQLRPGKKVLWRWHTPELAPESDVEILLQAKSEKTGVVVNHTRIQTRADADAVRTAWADALDRLAALFA